MAHVYLYELQRLFVASGASSDFGEATLNPIS